MRGNRSAHCAQAQARAARARARSLSPVIEPLARRVVSVHVAADEVTATTLGLSSATARYEKGFGCSLRD